MIAPSSPLLAQVGQPLFGNQWVALLVILVGVAVFIAAVAAVGRWLAATHPDEPAKPAAAPSGATPRPAAAGAPPEIFAVIAASVVATFGSRSRVSSVTLVPATTQGQWSLEGRRQIYSSHQVR